MRNNHSLINLFSGNKRLLETFYRRVENQDIIPRNDDPIEIKIALRAYSNFISDRILAERVKIKRMQEKFKKNKEDHDEEANIQYQ